MATGIFLIVTSRGVLLVSSEYRPGMLLKILLCTTPTTKNSPKMSVVVRQTPASSIMQGTRNHTP